MRTREEIRNDAASILKEVQKAGGEKLSGEAAIQSSFTILTLGVLLDIRELLNSIESELIDLHRQVRRRR